MGVQRQYSGTAGRIEIAQLAVYLAYAAPAGHTLIDRRLYLPKDWCEDPQRRAAAGVPDEVEFATKPALAVQMITAALEAGMPAGWVAGDEVYGVNPELRQRLQQRGIGYVLGIGANRTVRVEMADDVVLIAARPHCPRTGIRCGTRCLSARSPSGSSPLCNRRWGRREPACGQSKCRRRR